MIPQVKSYNDLLRENEALLAQLEDANETLEAIRTGNVDALIVQGNDGHELYTLKTADAGYRVFIEKMNEGAVTLSEDGIILYGNSAFAAMVGGSMSQAIGHPFEQFVTADCKDIYTGLFRRSWDVDSKVELTITGGLREMPCQLSVTRLEVEEGTMLSVILTDLTAQKETERQLKEKARHLELSAAALASSNDDLQQFASVASHDLQEPLRKIAIFSDILRKGLGDTVTGANAEALDKIIASSLRLKAMVVDILSYSRLAGRESDPGEETTDLNAVVRELMEDFEILISERSAQVTVGALPSVDVSRGSMRQVFQNLLSNALKFCSPETACIIEIDVADPARVDEPYRDGTRYALISVKDNGIGFDERFSEKIFSLFHRLNTKDKYEGSGIGLAVTRKIMDRAGGAIRVHSREGEGSEFILILPLRA